MSLSACQRCLGGSWYWVSSFLLVEQSLWRLQATTMNIIVELRGLEQLRALGCMAMTDIALLKLSEHQTLKSLELGCNTHFTDTGIAALAAMQGAHPQLSSDPVCGLASMEVFALDVLCSADG